MSLRPKLWQISPDTQASLLKQNIWFNESIEHFEALTVDLDYFRTDPNFARKDH